MQCIWHGMTCTHTPARSLCMQGAKRKGKPKAEYSGAALVGQRIIVKWNVEGSEALYIGRVGSFKKVRTPPCLLDLPRVGAHFVQSQCVISVIRHRI